jgi:hypothetical protein
MKQNTKIATIYNVLYDNINQRVSLLTLHQASNCMCIGAVCANIRKLWCVVDNEEKRVKNAQWQLVVHSSYKMTKWIS